MNRILGGILVLALVLPASAADVNKAGGKPRTPKEQYQALLKAYFPAAGAFRKATTDRERKAAVERLGGFARKFLDLADKHPGDAVALLALRQAVQAVSSTDSAGHNAWEMNRGDFPAGRDDGSASRIVKLLLRDHVRSRKIGPVIDRMRYGYRMEFEEGLTAILRDNPHAEIRAVAYLALARFLNDRLRVLQLVEDRPELKKRHAILFGKDYLRRLQRAARVKRIETLFERAARYDDVKVPFGPTVGVQAKAELYELRKLGVGKPAPEIAAPDQDSKPFKLSDYRGKVVLLYFWQEY